MKARLSIIGVALTMLVVACGGGGAIEVGDVWARASASTQDAGAVYMTITGGDTADKLVGVSVSSDVAAVAELHESMAGDGGMMTMEQVEAIDVPADGEASLAPGGYHVMLMQLTEPLQDGATFDVTLIFENAGEMVVSAEVREE